MKYNITEKKFMNKVRSYAGLCLKCGTWTSSGVEGDAENYQCDKKGCGAMKVMGAELALASGYIVIAEK